MSSKTSHARIDRTLLKKIKTETPDFSVNEITKVGFNILKSINKTGEFIYGKQNWKKLKK